MIRLAREKEPEALRKMRPDKLEAVRQAMRRGEDPAFEGVGRPEIKEVLFKGQHGKCAYCEWREPQAKYRDVDHYRPKSTYWWLAWTWENLLFSCIDCNRDHKKAQFPLRDEARRLVAESAPPGDEEPLLLDPYDSTLNLRAELQFLSSKVQSKERWQPFGRTERGEQTIEICGLRRQGLVELYTDHVNRQVRREVEKVRGAAGDARAVVSAWASLRRSLLASGQPFHLLSLDASEHLLRQEIAQYRLPL
jgi:uncharacterized protein (TIGR02646 family)